MISLEFDCISSFVNIHMYAKRHDFWSIRLEEIQQKQ